MTDKQLAILLRKYEQVLMAAVREVEFDLPDSLAEGDPGGDGESDPLYPVLLPIIGVAMQMSNDAKLLAPEPED